MPSVNATIRIPKPEYFNFSECLHFLDRGYDDCLYRLERDHVIKPLRIEGQQTLFQLSEDTDALLIKILAGTFTPRTLNIAGNYVKTWFDLKRNLHPFYHLLDKYKHLSRMSSQYHGLRLIGIPDLFEALCWCVIGQQINLTFAHRLKRRLVETYGTFISRDSQCHYYFPTAKVLSGLQIGDLRDMQFSQRKAEYIIGIAQQFVDGNLSKHQLANLPDSSHMRKRLMEIRGVGEWTANYVLMKSLGKADCITFGDTGLQSAVSAILGLDRKPTREEIEKFFEPFAGWESYLVIYLWRTLS